MAQLAVVDGDADFDEPLSLLLVLLDDDPLSEDDVLDELLSPLLDPPDSEPLDVLLSEDDELSLLPPTGRFFVP